MKTVYIARITMYEDTILRAVFAKTLKDAQEKVVKEYKDLHIDSFEVYSPII